jgi:hypothetical protein
VLHFIDELAFRFNNRKDLNDSDRSNALCSQSVGKRLTFAEVTGKLGPTAFRN